MGPHPVGMFPSNDAKRRRPEDGLQASAGGGWLAAAGVALRAAGRHDGRRLPLQADAADAADAKPLDHDLIQWLYIYICIYIYNIIIINITININIINDLIQWIWSI